MSLNRLGFAMLTMGKDIDVNFCKDHHNKIEVPDPLAVEDLISSKLNNKGKFAKLITQYRDILYTYPYTV